jgi:ribosomal protein S18 acetylase RimI-like enzyme
MSSISTLTCPKPVLREMGVSDLPMVVRIEQQGPTPRCAWQDFLLVYSSGGAASRVAEVEGQVVGFLVYRAPERCNQQGPGRLKRLLRRCLPWREADPPSPPMELELLDIGVAPAWHRRGIGRALLKGLEAMLQSPGDCIRATVPETNLPVQLLLRDAGYRALSVLRGYFGKEDGYLMERRRS